MFATARVDKQKTRFLPKTRPRGAPSKAVIDQQKSKEPETAGKPIEKEIASEKVEIEKEQDSQKTLVNEIVHTERVYQQETVQVVPKKVNNAKEKMITTESGEKVFNVPQLTLHELVSVNFQQGKSSEFSAKLKEHKKNSKKRKEPPQEPVIVQPKIEQSAPQVKIVDGKIQLDEESLFVHHDAADATQSLQVVDETIGKYVTSASFRKNQRTRCRWSAQMTASFYQALSMFGADFHVIAIYLSTQYPEAKFERRQVKLKFDNEEKTRHQIVTAALKNRKKPDQETMERMMETVKEQRQLESEE